MKVVVGYQSEELGSFIWPVGWTASPACIGHLVVIPPESTVSALYCRLHEYAHVLQLERGVLTEAAYWSPRHHMFLEAEASALALIWVRPEMFGAALLRAIDGLDGHRNYLQGRLPIAYKDSATYLSRHMFYLQRRFS